MSKDVQFCNRDRFIELGLTIAALRKMQGLSQEQLAEKAKISRSHLSSIEAPNIVRPFSVEVLYNIADALGVRAGDCYALIFCYHLGFCTTASCANLSNGIALPFPFFQTIAASITFLHRNDFVFCSHINLSICTE